MISAVSVKDRLRYQSKKDGMSFQDKLVTYGFERTIYRISISTHCDKFTLKGGLFLYALFKGAYTRTTMDMDFLVHKISNEKDNMKKMFHDILSIECDDALRYDLDSLQVINITELKEYHGLKVTINAYLDKTLIPVSIDIGFDDIIYPNRVKMDFPVLLNNEIPSIYVYSMYSVIAEKFEAIVSLGLANSRYKDFYDIYVLATEYDLDGALLSSAIKETFTHRSTTLNDIVAFEDEYINSPINKQRWTSFTKKKKSLINIGFEETISLIKTLLCPIIDSINNSIEFTSKWSKDERIWK